MSNIRKGQLEGSWILTLSRWSNGSFMAPVKPARWDMQPLYTSLMAKFVALQEQVYKFGVSASSSLARLSLPALCTFPTRQILQLNSLV